MSKPIGTVGSVKFGSVFRMSDAEMVRVGLKKPPRGPLTVKVVYPVHVCASAMYYKTEMIAKSEVAKWIELHRGLEILW